ncbi:hypothetical protein EUX98_g9238 [Antrodiella citrinella]|uniref:Uncharacterized protein n=1 Tax=Antrodiella citrinella TaxID=2447956 RepID=A0A4S4LWF4_9APHY|nr:hypothetical protein EUX98_g9238 [Antrodiella citrinella]
MAGSRKRSADEAGAETGPSTKVPRTATKGKPKAKKGPKTNLAPSEFKARALPLHVNLTHTPPSIPDEDTDNATSADPGFVGTTALLPSVFSTGSYGWKGNKRITVEVENRETGEKEKVNVMVTINATVMGSKNAGENDAEDDVEHDPQDEDESAAAEVDTAE